MREKMSLKEMLKHRLHFDYVRLRKWLWAYLQDTNESRSAYAFNLLLITLTVLSVVLVSLDTASSVHLKDNVPAREIDYAIYAVFTFDFFWRVVLHCNHRIFWTSPFTWSDLLSLISFYLELIFPSSDGNAIQLFSLLRPAFRLFSLSRNYFGFRILRRSLLVSAESLPIPMFTLLLMVVTGSTFLYFFEHATNPLIDSIPQGMYFSIVAIATVGFGDVYPITVAGKITTCCLIILGVMYMAMPLAIVGSNFLETWESRDRDYLIHRIEERIIRHDSNPSDLLLKIFRAFDTNCNGHVNIDEFLSFCDHFKLRIKRERLVDLFLSLDADDDGVLCLAEFARALFPHHVWTKEDLERKQLELTVVRRMTSLSLQESSLSLQSFY
jgi:voltage-gated potassium channel